MALILRLNQANALTYTELDGNFVYLDGRITSVNSSLTTNITNVSSSIVNTITNNSSSFSTSITNLSSSTAASYTSLSSSVASDTTDLSAISSSLVAVSSSYAPLSSSYSQLSRSLSVNVANVITTGSATAFQSITGSLIISSSFRVIGKLETTGSIFATKYIGTFGTTAYGGIGPALDGEYNSISEIYNVTATKVPAFPFMFNNPDRVSTATVGGVQYVFTDIGIGYPGLNSIGSLISPAVYFSKTAASTAPYPKYMTVISDNTTVTLADVNNGIYTTNGRNHTLTVTGSFLSLDGVSLGTHLSDTHHITGSTKFTGSMYVYGLTTPPSTIASTNILVVSSSGQIFLTASSATGGTFDTASFVSTSSFNQFTSSVVTTSSFNQFTSSVVSTSSFNQFTSSVVTTSSFNMFTGSVITTGSIGASQSITGSLTLSGSFIITGSISLNKLVTSSAVTNVLTYDTTNGKVYYTASTAIGGGNSGFVTTTTFNDFTGSVITTGSVGRTQSITGSLTMSGSYDIKPNFASTYMASLTTVNTSIGQAFGALILREDSAGTGNVATLKTDNLTADRTVALPNNTGTLLMRINEQEGDANGNITITGSITTGLLTTSSFNAFTSSVVTTSSFNSFTGSVITTGSISIRQSITGSLIISGSNTSIIGLITASAANLTNVLMISSSGQLFTTASSAIGGGGNTTNNYYTSASFISSGSVSASVNTNSASFKITSGSSTFMFVSNSGQIGFGTTSSQDRVQIYGDIALRSGSNVNTNYGMIKFGTDDPNNLSHYAGIASSGYGSSIAKANLMFITDGSQGPSEKMRIYGGGSVTIGTTSSLGFKVEIDAVEVAPGSALRIYQDNTNTLDKAGTGSHIHLDNPNSLGTTAITSYISGSFRGKILNTYEGDYHYVVSGSGDHYFWTQGYQDSGAIRMYISASGNVGIGPNFLGPKQTLTVSGSVGFLNMVTASVPVTNVLMISSSGQVFLTASSAIGGGGGGLSGGTPNYIPKWTSTSQLSTSSIYDNSGNIGIGITSPITKLDVDGFIHSAASLIGDANQASNGSLVSGISSSAYGIYSQAQGAFTEAWMYSTHAEGYATFVGNRSPIYYSVINGNQVYIPGRVSYFSIADTIIGLDTGFGGTQVAEGNITNISYNSQTGITTITIDNSLYNGIEVTTWTKDGIIPDNDPNDAAHAEGVLSIAVGSGAHAEGIGTSANNISAHSEGLYTIASGVSSHTEGEYTKAHGECSHAEGYSTIALGDYQHVQGKWNLTSSLQAAFIHGNGTSDSNRSNLIFASGSEVQISGSLKITGSAILFGLVTSSTSNVITYNTTTGQLYYTASSAIGGGGNTTNNYYNTSSFITSGSITASVNIGATSFQVTSGSNTLIAVRNNGDTIISGSLTIVTGSTEFQVLETGTKIGNISSDFHTITGSLNISGSINMTGSAYFSSSRFVINANDFTIQSSGTQLGNATTDAHTITGSLGINGNVYITASLTSNPALIVEGSGSSNSVFSVRGSLGELFSVSDTLTGSLFSVNDISGLPILDVNSDQTTKIGSFLAPGMYTSTKVTANSGITVIYSLPTASYDGAWYDYTIRSGSISRAGSIIAIWSGSQVNYSEVSASSFGTSTGFVFGASILGGNMILSGSAPTNTWIVKTIIRSI